MTADWAATKSYDRGTCSVCDREMRVLKNGTIGPHVTGRPDPHGSPWSPRCPGWGRKPKSAAAHSCNNCDGIDTDSCAFSAEKAS